MDRPRLILPSDSVVPASVNGNGKPPVSLHEAMEKAQKRQDALKVEATIKRLQMERMSYLRLACALIVKAGGAVTLTRDDLRTEYQFTPDKPLEDGTVTFRASVDEPEAEAEAERCPSCGTQVRENVYWSHLAGPASPRVYYPESVMDDNAEIRDRFTRCHDLFHATGEDVGA